MLSVPVLGSVLSISVLLSGCCSRPCCPRPGDARSPGGVPALPVNEGSAKQDPLDPPYFVRVKLKNASAKTVIAASTAGFKTYNCVADANNPLQFPPPPLNIGNSYPLVDATPLAVGAEASWPPTGTAVGELPQLVRSVSLEVHVEGDTNPCTVCIPCPAGKKLMSVDIDFLGKDGTKTKFQYKRLWYVSWDTTNKKWNMDTDTNPVATDCTPP